MKVLVTSVAASLFFIGVATQIYDQLFPENLWYLLVSMSIASIFASLITVRVDGRLTKERSRSSRPKASPRRRRGSGDQKQPARSDAPRGLENIATRIATADTCQDCLDSHHFLRRVSPLDKGGFGFARIWTSTRLESPHF